MNCCSWLIKEIHHCKIDSFYIHCCYMIIQFKENKYQIYSWVNYIGVLIVMLGRFHPFIGQEGP